MEEKGHISTENRGGTLWISFGHPKGNSLPGEILSGLAERFDAAANDGSVRVIVLASEGSGAFCAGASFSELRSINSAEAGRSFFMGFAKVILAMKRCPKLVIGRIHGKAVGGGVGLVSACDYAIAADTAAVRLSELALGIGPFVVGPAVERRIGSGAFSGMAIDADWRSAEWAHERGLYTQLVSGVDSLDAAVEKLAATLAVSSTDAMADLKKALWLGTESWDDLLPARAEVSGRLVLGEFSQTAIRKAAERQR